VGKQSGQAHGDGQQHPAAAGQPMRRAGFAPIHLQRVRHLMLTRLGIYGIEAPSVFASKTCSFNSSSIAPQAFG
jgi:hypothetical protein